MKGLSNEFKTGVLVLLTLGVLGYVIVQLAAPALFTPTNHFQVYFDNAAGIKPGAQVLLAGRKIGQVTSIYSPVPEKERPDDHPTYEVRIGISVDKDAVVYQNVTVTMTQLSMLGERVIDMSGGSEQAGLAADGESFVGVRSPDFAEVIPEMLEVLKPVAAEAEKTLAQLEQTAAHLSELTGGDSDLVGALASFKEFGENVAGLTGENGGLTHAIDNLDEFTRQLTEGEQITATLDNFEQITAHLNELVANQNIEIMLENFRQVSDDADSVMSRLDETINLISPQLDQAAGNLTQMTDTLKRQPWRLIWRGTVEYPEDHADHEETTVGEPRPEAAPARPASPRPRSHGFRR